MKANSLAWVVLLLLVASAASAATMTVGVFEYIPNPGYGQVAPTSNFIIRWWPGSGWGDMSESLGLGGATVTITFWNEATPIIRTLGDLTGRVEPYLLAPVRFPPRIQSATLSGTLFSGGGSASFGMAAASFGASSFGATSFSATINVPDSGTPPIIDLPLELEYDEAATPEPATFAIAGVALIAVIAGRRLARI
jgi:hypothetical protein